jgi:phage repressor protein C with HTH and peptisase S24 domain
MTKLERLTRYRLSQGYKTAKEFAQYLGITPNQISEIDKKGKAATLLHALQLKTNINLNWLETGEGPMFDHPSTLELVKKLRGGDPLRRGSDYDIQPTSNSFTMVKVYDRICCGDGVEPGGYEEIGVVYVPIKYGKPHIIMVRARGRSMEPAIKEGGYVGIDTSDREVVSGEMYAVCSQLEGAVVKRLVVKGDCLELVSENKVFEPVEIRDVPSYFVIGRVRLVVNEY